MAHKAPRTITAEMVADAVYRAIPGLACDLPDDVKRALVAARAAETSPRGQVVLDHLIENAAIAACDRVPLCQDTGSVWACLEIGPETRVAGDVFAGVDAAVARAFAEARLRTSLACDAALDRSNTGDNTPAFCELSVASGHTDHSGHAAPAGTDPARARLHLMLKGGGSDNASRVVMLVPGAGRQGIVEEVVACVREKAASACAPVVVGVGIGSTFDKVAGLAKRALMRRIDEPTPHEGVAALEAELLAAVNATGLGPGGLGGATTALAVKANTAPCHIAALPLAVNMGCSAMRRLSIDL
ncbi:MAG: fumarate hydratase [Eggerthellaceae bacterium]|nr:fumarate hydratase [Eggerthellaceae bacterium]